MSDVHIEPIVRFAPRPVEWTAHATARLQERHPALASTQLRADILRHAECETWEPGDLDGLGQGIYRHPGTQIRVAVDGNWLVRTVLP